MGSALINEPQRQLLGQLPHRKLLGQAQGCLRAWPARRYPGASKAGHHELDGLFQLPQIAFELGLSQPNAIGEMLVGTAQKGRVSRELRTPQNRGNITLWNISELNLFSDAKTGENYAQQIIGGEFSCNAVECSLR